LTYEFNERNRYAQRPYHLDLVFPLMFFQICGIHAAILEMKDLDALPNRIFHAKPAASIILFYQ